MDKDNAKNAAIDAALFVTKVVTATVIFKSFGLAGDAIRYGYNWVKNRPR